MEYFVRNKGSEHKDDVRLIGATVPINIFNYINLFCVVDSRSKSSIIRPVIENWFNEASAKFPEKELISLAAAMGYRAYKERGKRRPFRAVIQQQERELEKKGVTKSQRRAIIRKIREMQKNESKERAIKRERGVRP